MLEWASMMDAATYRNVIGHFATGVTVVTTAIDGWLHGMTANALTSVSLDPLLLLVVVDKAAHAHAQIERAGRFCVNVLSADQESASRAFAEKAPPERDGLRGVAYHLGKRGMPVIEGCLAYLDCEVVERYAGGDHSIFIGEVLGGEVAANSEPLLFYQAKYRRLAGN